MQKEDIEAQAGRMPRASTKEIWGLIVQRGWVRGVVTVFALASLLAWASPAAASGGGEGFGIQLFENLITTGGVPAVQAGSHPDSMTTTIVFDHHAEQGHKGGGAVGEAPDGNPESIEVNLPAGFIVNPTVTSEKCTEAELLARECPPGSAVGTLSAQSTTFPNIQGQTVYNMVPPPTVPSDFALNLANLDLIVHIVGKVRTGADSGLSAQIPGISQRGGFFSSTVSFNGFPAGPTGKPLFTMPTSCGSPLTTTMSARSWQQEFAEALPSVNHNLEGNPVAVTGCEDLSFDPELKVRPSTTATDSPSGLSVEINVPREESAGGLAQADLKDAVVTLPAGMSVSTSAASGLGACTLQQIDLASAAAPSCPDSSKIASVEITTPLLEVPLHGSLYLAQQGNAGPAQGENPFGSLLAMYLVAEGPGVVLKIPGEVRLDPVTGQLTAHFGEDPLTRPDPSFLPQLPFSSLKLDFFGDPSAPLSTPSQCGTYTVTSQLTPWSAPQSGPPATPSSSFTIDQGCHGQQFDPTFTAGTVSNRAGAFSPFTVTLHRGDGEAELSRVQVQLPPGLSGDIASVPLCGEPQAAQAACPETSLIGHVTAGVGAGPNQFYVSGRVYLTGPYGGAPFGLAIVVPAVAGPFDLGTVVDRASLSIDPHTAAATVTSDPLPQILQGIPLQIRTVNVTIDRKGFVFNPTSCAPLTIAAQATSPLGQGAALASPFQAGDCASLSFAPQVKVSTSAHASRANGASLDFKLTYPNVPLGSQANVAMAKVELPLQLPSRLTTLQKACPATTFEADPAACSAASVIGIARATTPILPVPVSGPAYFVSHGGAAFPDLVIVLQGDGVRVDLVGSTFISKRGVTSTTLKTVPDLPVGSFELYLPAGKYSALAANGNLCRGTLKMPTTLVAQNGAEIHQSNPIAVAGCPQTIKAHRHRGARNATRGRGGPR